MAHQRIIKSEFFTDEGVADLPPLVRLFFIGMWCQADRKGVLEDKPRQLKQRILPYDELDVVWAINLLIAHRFLVRFRVGGETFLHIRTWGKNQSIHGSEKDSKLPSITQATEIVNSTTPTSGLPVSAPVADGGFPVLPSPVPVPVPVPSPVPVPAFAEPPQKLPAASAPAAAEADPDFVAFFAQAQDDRLETFPNAFPEPPPRRPARRGQDDWPAFKAAVPDPARRRDTWRAYLLDPYARKTEPPCCWALFISQWHKYVPGQDEQAPPADPHRHPCEVRGCASDQLATAKVDGKWTCYPCLARQMYPDQIELQPRDSA